MTRSHSPRVRIASEVRIRTGLPTPDGTGRSLPTIEELKGTRAVVAMDFAPEALGTLVFRRDPARLELLFDPTGRLVASSQPLANIARKAATSGANASRARVSSAP